MKHYCIFEISHPNKQSECYKTKYVEDYGEDYAAADEMCQSMNNFRESEEEVHFCVRCLEQEEFDNVENYDPIVRVIVITKSTMTPAQIEQEVNEHIAALLNSDSLYADTVESLKSMFDLDKQQEAVVRMALTSINFMDKYVNQDDSKGFIATAALLIFYAVQKDYAQINKVLT